MCGSLCSSAQEEDFLFGTAKQTKHTNESQTVFMESYSDLWTQDTPLCCLGQLGLKSAGFGLVPEIWKRTSSCVREWFLKGRLEKKKRRCSFVLIYKTCINHFCPFYFSFHLFFTIAICGPQSIATVYYKILCNLSLMSTALLFVDI